MQRTVFFLVAERGTKPPSSSATMARSTRAAIPRLGVTLLGSGNWGSAVARMVGQNLVLPSNTVFERTLKMWVFPELYEGRSLTDIINETRENPKYLPGAILPSSVVASSDLESCCRDADLLLFCLPHQFIPPLLTRLAKLRDSGVLSATCVGVSLVKGLFVLPPSPSPAAPGPCEPPSSAPTRDSLQLRRVSSLIEERVPGLRVVGVVSGANVASDLALEQLAEATIGFRLGEEIWAKRLRELFERPYFRVTTVQDVAGLEFAGALKNIVALAAGLIDGLGLAANTKAAVIRLGMLEMRHFARTFAASSWSAGTVHRVETVRDEVFFESCGLADTIATCYAGRNRKCAEAFAQLYEERVAAKGLGVEDATPQTVALVTFEELERSMLDGQKLQGTGTAHDVYQVLCDAPSGVKEQFPIFCAVYAICFEGLPPRKLLDAIRHAGSSS